MPGGARCGDIDIETGLSDGIRIEIVSGVTEKDAVKAGAARAKG